MMQLVIKTNTTWNDNGTVNTPGEWWYEHPDGFVSDQFDSRDECFPDAYEKFPGIGIG